VPDTIDLWANWNVVGSSSIGQPDTIFVGHDDGGGEQNKWFCKAFHANSPEPLPF
jgi:hypothetical protein